MPDISRRAFLSTSIAVGGGGLLPAAIARAAAIAPDVRTGTLQDVDHVVILMQENRGFDHYFGTLRGVRGFADRFPIPLAPVEPGAAPRNVWQQYDRTARGGARLVSPFHLDTRADFDLMRMEGTPHAWPDAQAAWDDGRMAHWPEAKHQRAMGHYRRADLPFQFALAEAFTLCDAYHCSVQTGTNTNRLFLWTGTNDPDGHHGGPAIGNSHDSFVEQGGAADPYRWQTVAEAMQAAGIDWRIYQDMANNFTDNPLVGFAAFRDAYHGLGDPALKERALTTYGLDRLRADAITGRLPQVSYIIATDTGCEHPNPSSPAQGAAYTAEVLDALTANPAVWARTALLVMFDENDGFFDHVPPPAPPSRASDGTLAGGSTVDLTGAYHLVPSVGDHELDLPAYRGRAYGLGARVPMYVVSPWSRGGWVNSQVFDHTSVIRFLEKRFGFHASGTSPWRREICGDLTSAFDFTKADVSLAKSPDTRQDARRARVVPHQVAPDAPPGATGAPWQESGVRRSRPLPYRLDVTVHRISTGMALTFAADGQGAVFHVYNRHALADAPRRYMVAAGHRLNGTWDFSRDGDYDLWILGPNGFHRHFVGHKDDQPLDVSWTIDASSVSLDVGRLPRAGMVTVTRLLPGGRSTSQPLVPGVTRWSTQATAGWHDITIIDRNSAYRRRIAGRYDQPNRESISDPFLPLS